MKTIKTSLLSAAVAGLLFGATSCKKDENPAPAGGNAPNKAAPSGGGKVQPAALAIADKHACKGLNSCNGKGGCKTGDKGCAGKNSCKGNGGCATVEHSCQNKNACKTQGGCQGKAGKNDCSGKGGCGVPVKH